MQWTFVRTLLPNADMPFLKKVTTGSGSSSDASWILLTHEQWMRPGSETPSQLGFKLYYNESQLAAGDPFNSFVAPLTVGSHHMLEGTPGIYDARIVHVQPTPTPPPTPIPVYEPPADLYPNRQQCDSDGLWYACTDSNCNQARTCTSNTGLHGCACPGPVASSTEATDNSGGGSGDSGYWAVEADIGFHYRSEIEKDQVASGQLSGFGESNLTPQFTASHSSTWNDLFFDRGGIGNVGQREAGLLPLYIPDSTNSAVGEVVHLCLQEANIGAEGPGQPTIWEDWRVWLYRFAPDEGPVPTGAAGDAVQLQLQTHLGSIAAGNPSWRVLGCPDGDAAPPSDDEPEQQQQQQQCLFVSYFLFGEGAQPGEAGALAYYKHLTSMPPTPAPAPTPAVYVPDPISCPDRQHCQADGLWYCCGDSNCGHNRACASNTGLNGCACEL
jgi:hypothetical protein